MAKVLHVGCGPQTVKDRLEFLSWEETRYDIDRSVNPDVLGSLQEIPEYLFGQFDAVVSEHNLEHVGANEVVDVLSNLKACLKPEGTLHVRVPDLESVFVAALSKGLDEPLYTSPAGPITARDVIYGHEDAVANGKTYMRHLTGFTSKTLQKSALAAGFSKPLIWRYPMNFELYMKVQNA